MGYSSSLSTSILLLVVVLNVTNGQPLVPALFIFGDSTADVGNNNNLLTINKANFPPYGRDFKNHIPTGRFCSGKRAIDFTAETFGFTSSPPAYLNLEAKGKNLLNGASFVSAGSGFLDSTSKIYNLYALEARKIGVATLPPTGCLPAIITLLGFHSNECVERLNNDAINLNKKLNTTSQNLQKQLPGLKLVFIDVYSPFYNLITHPSEYGFFEARKACCGMGLLKSAIVCNTISIGTCVNASEYVFWDSFHPSEAVNKLLTTYVVLAIISLIS